MTLWDEEAEYDVRLVLRDSGSIVIYMKTPEHPSFMITTLYSGDTRYWNWLFHLKLIRNSDGTFTGIVTDEYGHHFEGTTSLTAPLDVPLRVNLSAYKWKYGYPVMIFYDNFKAFGTPEEATQYLVTTIESWILPKGTKEPLTHKLEDAVSLLSKDNLNGAIHKLNDFIKHVEVFCDKKLTYEQADSLIASAQAIIDAIG
jgi:hypothetical protein